MGMRRGAAAMVLAVVALAACGKTTDSGAETSDDWLTSTDPVATSPLVWAGDSVVHLADGTDIDLGGLPSAYVVAGDGVFFVPAASTEQAEAESRSSGQVHFIAPGEGRVDTGLRLRADTLRASPDGRFIVGIDVVSGPKDDFGTPLAEVVVHDLIEGREVVRTSEQMGDTSGDLFDLYEDAQISVGAVTEDTAYVDGVSGTFALALATGKVDERSDEPLPALGSLVSPAGEWTIRQVDRLQDQVTDSDGKRLPLKVPAPRWTLNWWADATTVVGAAVHGPGTGADTGLANHATLMTCAVPTGVCRTHDGSTGVLIRFPNGTTYPLTKRLIEAG